MQYFFDTRSCADISSLCSRFTGKRLQSPTRSTLPLLDLVHNSRDAWHGLLQRLGAPSDGAIYFEFGVPSPKPGGNASQTDAVFLSDFTAWAVEAKWTEPRDNQTVTKRLSKPESDGADPRGTVSGWLAHLQPFASQPLLLEEMSGVIYQMLHRAASAAYIAAERKLDPALVYIHFVPSPDQRAATTAHYVAELLSLRERLDASAKFPFSVVEMPITNTPLFETIRDLDKHSPATSLQVKEALRSGPLFTFGEPSITVV